MKTEATSTIQAPSALLMSPGVDVATREKTATQVTAHVRRAARLPMRPALLPHRYRDTLIALAAFYRETRTLGLAATTDDGSARLDAWEMDVHRMNEVHTAPNAVLSPLAAAELPTRPLLDLIEAQRLRAHTYSYATYADLLAYCAMAANPLGRLILAMLGEETEEHIAQADALCTALLQTQLWRDIARDYVRGRVYLPREDMHLFGVTEEDLAEAVQHRQACTNLRALIAFEVERTRHLLDEGATVTGSLKRRGRLDCLLLIADARAMLATIARHGYDPFVARPTLGRFERFGAIIGMVHLFGALH